jgi:tetratricopeptide (TPR) repeat protein
MPAYTTGNAPWMPRLLPLLAAGLIALTSVSTAVFPAPPAGRPQALAWLDDAQTERRAEAVTWLANHGGMKDAPLLEKRLLDESPFVRSFAEQGLWLLWSRSGDAAIDRMMARGVDEMQAGEHAKAIATFSEVISKKPEFAEGWNKRATVYYLAGEHRKSLADCDEVIKRNPGHFGALAGYGQIWYALQDYEKALAAWRRALKANPNMLGVEINIKGVEELLKQKRGKTI